MPQDPPRRVAAGSPSGPSGCQDATVEDEGFAAVVWREEGRWESGLLPHRLIVDLDGLIAGVRQQPGEGGAIGLVDVEDEFFIAIRMRPGGDVSLLLSDVTASA